MSNFWTQVNIEPKRKFRWLISFAGMPQFIAKSVTKPSFSVGTSGHNFLQHQFNFPGRVTWNDISITIVDPVQPDATVSLYKIIENAGYVLPTDVMSGPEGMRTISKKGMVESLGNQILIEQIGIDGSANDAVTEQWVVNNPLITSVAFDSLDYTTDELLNITIGIKYDWASLNETAAQSQTSWQK